MSDHWSDDPVWRNFARHALEDMLPKLVDSNVSISMVPRPGKAELGDVKYWTELGASVMLDKPIILLVHPSRCEIPEKLRLLADMIIVADPTSPAGQQEISERLTVFLEKLP
jgi:hypothetical protein